LNAEDLIELCTLGGARAIGLDGETGSLQPGKWADCTVIRVPQGNNNPAELVLHSSTHDVLGTYVGGREVFRAL
jgi:5-methylthioadenosine/S-adenosylhomocysteine deaminase